MSVPPPGRRVGKDCCQSRPLSSFCSWGEWTDRRRLWVRTSLPFEGTPERWGDHPAGNLREEGTGSVLELTFSSSVFQFK